MTLPEKRDRAIEVRSCQGITFAGVPLDAQEP